MEVHRLIENDELGKRALDLLRRENSATGWSIARTLDADPEIVGKSLANLRRGGLIDSESGSGLDGFYFLTRLAYRLISQAS